jgi:hypothetical protein
MFRNNALSKIEDKDCRVLRQLDAAASRYQCDKKMLVLYTRRLGPSTLMTTEEYRHQLSELAYAFPQLDYIACKDYFGQFVFYPPL